MGHETLPRGECPVFAEVWLKILSVTTLYPNAEQPTFGVFVENRLRQVAAVAGVEVKVVAPVPWFPSRSRWFGRYGAHGRVPLAETRHGIDITHPRFVQIPKIGTNLSPFLLYLCLLRHIRRLILPDYDFDVIDAHFYYPDGVAAALLARTLGKPVVVTARGTDLNLSPKRHPLVRRMIARAAKQVDASITVCAALKDVLVDLGTDPDQVHVLRNGVDLEMFKPADRAAVRRIWRIRRQTLLSVGHLIERKGHDLVVQALADLPDMDLIIAGDGPERDRLERLAASLNVADRVRILGVVDHHRLAELYSAVDLLVLASSREGWPNVLLEALACGTPVVATRIWGTAEIVTMPEAGRLIDQRSPGAIAKAVRDVLGHAPDHARTRAFAECFSWEATTEGQLRLFSSLVRGRSGLVADPVSHPGG